MKKYEKKYLVLISIVFIVILFIIVYIYFGKDNFLVKKETQKLIDKYDDSIIKREFFSDTIKTQNPKVQVIRKEGSNEDIIMINPENENKFDEKKKDEIQSFIRAICQFYNTPEEAVNSKYFKGLKNKINDYRIKYNNDNEFNIIELPRLVLGNCNRDAKFTEFLIVYSQMEGEVILITTFEEYQKNTIEYVRNLVLKTNGIDKKLLLNDKKYFDNYFLNQELKTLSAFYHPYFIQNNKDLNKFLNKPRDMGNLDIKAESIFSLEYNLKQLGIKDIKEFKKIIKNHYKINLRDELLKDYDELKKGIKKLGYDLTFLEENSYLTFQNFIKNGSFKKFLDDINKDEKLKNTYLQIYKNMILFDIIGNDYPDNFTEQWQAEQYFGDKNKGNGLIRLKFIYFLGL